MQRIHRSAWILVAIGTGLVPPATWASDPHFDFDDTNSTASLSVTANAFDGCTFKSDSRAANGFGYFANFTYSGGTVDWGNTLNIVADAGAVKASGNPLVRLDGDNTNRIEIVWKALNILSASVKCSKPNFTGDANSGVIGTLLCTIKDLEIGVDYEVRWHYTRECDARTIHEANGEDPNFAFGALEVHIAGGGPGIVFLDTCDSEDTDPVDYEFARGHGATRFTANATQASFSADVIAACVSEFAWPDDDDFVLGIFRGTLVLEIFGPEDPPALPDVLISEVVKTDLPNGTVSFVELTNCSDQDVAFGDGGSVDVYFDGAGSPGTRVDLSGFAIFAGQSFVITSSVNNGADQFAAVYGRAADLVTDDAIGDGNDTYALQFSGHTHDIYGVAGLDGAGTAWDHTDSYAYSRTCRAPNYGHFDVDDFVVGEVGTLQGNSDDEIVGLLSVFTTPFVHVCCTVAPFVRGDMNCDGLVDFNDIDPFVLALISQDDYEAAYPGCNYENGDANGDGAVNFDDIDGFVECLINGGC